MSRPSTGRRATLCMRVTPVMRAALDAAADANGRSLTQEIEMRLEHSFRADDIVERITEAQRLRFDVPDFGVW